VAQHGSGPNYKPLIGVLLTVTVVGVALVLLIRNWMASAPPTSKPVAQEVRIIRPPPPPPDVEPPPPPPPEEEVDVAEPEPTPEAPSNEPPPGEQLGLDADGTAGADGFGLAARKGARELLGTGGSAYAWYAGLVKGEILDRLSDDERIRRGAYSVSVRVWVAGDGSVERVRLAQSTGDRERDRAIESALSGQRISRSPPADMPQPISIRIVSRA
jgi:protein TonB